MLALGAVTLAGCGTRSTAAPVTMTLAPMTAVQFPFTFDNCGTKVTINSRPQRVLTIGTPAVDALHQAGASDKVVARAGEYGVPATGPAGTAVESKPIIDPLTNLLAEVDQSVELNIEALLVANPDVIVVIYGYETGDTLDKARQHLLSLPGVSGMTAARNNALIGVTGPEAEASPIAVDGIERMARELNGSS